MLKLGEVSTPEMAEVLAINALAPAIINGKLRPFMEASATAPLVHYEEEPATPASHTLRFIVNVSAMEGRFYKVPCAGLGLWLSLWLSLRPLMHVPYLTVPYLTLPYLTLPYLTLPYLAVLPCYCCHCRSPMPVLRASTREA